MTEPTIIGVAKNGCAVCGIATGTVRATFVNADLSQFICHACTESNPAGCIAKLKELMSPWSARAA